MPLISEVGSNSSSAPTDNDSSQNPRVAQLDAIHNLLNINNSNSGGLGGLDASKLPPLR